jgi:hypothetical protein
MLFLLFSVISIFFRNLIFSNFLWAYFILIFLDSFYKNKSLEVAFLSIVSTIIQFAGYGSGFLVGVFSKKK